MSDREVARESATCKCFVGGLSWETTGNKLRAYFENFGAVREAFISYNRANGRPRGFGFVVFLDEAVAAKVVAAKHTIDRREVEVKYAVPKDETLHADDQAAGAPQARNDAANQGKKIFVGGLAPAVDEKALREHFQVFGTVEDAVVMHDHDKRPRGFGFITFSSEDAVQAVFARGAMQTIQGKQIEIKPAVPRDLMPPSARSQHVMMYLDPRYGDRRGARGQQFNERHQGLPRNLIPTMQPGQFNALAMQAAAGYGLQGADFGGKAPPGGLDLYGGVNGNGNVFGQTARAALAYNLASLHAQAHLNGMQPGAAAAAASKLGAMAALGPAANGLNLKALALGGGFDPAFQPSGPANGLGAVGDSANFPDQQQPHQMSQDFGAEAVGVGLGVGSGYGYTNPAFNASQAAAWSS